MTSTVPAALKAADITRYAVRAAQLEKVKPPVAYWCKFLTVMPTVQCCIAHEVL